MDITGDRDGSGDILLDIKEFTGLRSGQCLGIPFTDIDTHLE
jgi:hypothetical protein